MDAVGGWEVFHALSGLPQIFLSFKGRSLMSIIWKTRPFCFPFFSFFCIFQLHPEMRKLDHPQCYDELFGDPICNSDGLPERGQMFFSFLMSCTNWFKNLKSQCPFSVPNCRITGQEYRWGSSHADCPLLLTPWEFGNKRKWFPSAISDSEF